MSGTTTRILKDCVAAHLPPDLPRGAATDALGRELVSRGEIGAVEHALDRFGGLGHDTEQLMQECWPMMATGGVAARDPTLRRASGHGLNQRWTAYLVGEGGIGMASRRGLLMIGAI